MKRNIKQKIAHYQSNFVIFVLAIQD